MNSILDPEESASQALLDHIEDLSGADPQLVGEIYEFAGLGSKTDPFASQVNALQAFVESKASEVKKELKGKTVEEVIESRTGGVRRHGTRRRSHTRRRTTQRQRGGLGFLARIFIGILRIMAKVGTPGGQAFEMRELRPAWSDPRPVDKNFLNKVRKGWDPEKHEWKAPFPAPRPFTL